MRESIEREVEKIIDEAKQQGKMTALKRRFIEEIVKDPSHPTQAAIIAGYSPKSAKWSAHRLMKDPMVQSEIALHFVDHGRELTELLTTSLIRLRKIVNESNDNKFFRAFDKIMAYSKLAASILGLEMNIKDRKPAATPLIESNPFEIEELIEQHKRELDRLERLRILPGGTNGESPPPGEEEV